MMKVVCLGNHAVATQRDCAGTIGKHGGPGSSLQALILQKTECRQVPGACVPKRVTLSRPLSILLICVSVALVELVRKDGGAPVQTHSSVVVSTGGKYQGNGSGALSGYQFCDFIGVFLGVEAADATLKQKQLPYAGTSVTVKSCPNSGASAAVQEENEHTQLTEEGRAPDEKAFTRAAFEEALSRLEGNTQDLPEPVSVGAEPLKRHTESEVPAEGGIANTDPVDVEVNESDEQWAHERDDTREMVPSRDDLAELLPQIRRRHWLPDDSRTEPVAHVHPRRDELLTVVDGTDSSDSEVSMEGDVGETVEEPVVPTFEGKLGMDPHIPQQPREPRVLAVPPVAVLITVLLIAVALALAQAHADPDQVLVEQRSPSSRREGRSGYASNRMKNLEEETLGRDYLSDGEKNVGAQHVAWIHPSEEVIGVSLDSSGRGMRDVEQHAGVDPEQEPAVRSIPMGSHHAEHTGGEEMEQWEEHAKALGSVGQVRYKDKDVIPTSADISPQWIPGAAAPEYGMFGAHHG